LDGSTTDRKLCSVRARATSRRERPEKSACRSAGRRYRFKAQSLSRSTWQTQSQIQIRMAGRRYCQTGSDKKQGAQGCGPLPAYHGRPRGVGSKRPPPPTAQISVTGIPAAFLMQRRMCCRVRGAWSAGVRKRRRDRAMAAACCFAACREGSEFDGRMTSELWRDRRSTR
jgi:hypothetical protein